MMLLQQETRDSKGNIIGRNVPLENVINNRAKNDVIQTRFVHTKKDQHHRCRQVTQKLFEESFCFL